MGFGDVLTILGAPPVIAIHVGGVVLLAGVASGEPTEMVLRRAERATAFATAWLSQLVLLGLLFMLGDSL